MNVSQINDRNRPGFTLSATQLRQAAQNGRYPTQGKTVAVVRRHG